MNQKLKPHYDLEEVKGLLAEDKYLITATAIRTADSIGFSETDVVAALLVIERTDFYKSMTSNFNHRVWQDVYKKLINNIDLYIKFKINEADNNLVVILSFKEDENVKYI